MPCRVADDPRKKTARVSGLLGEWAFDYQSTSHMEGQNRLYMLTCSRRRRAQGLGFFNATLVADVLPGPSLMIEPTVVPESIGLVSRVIRGLLRSGM